MNTKDITHPGDFASTIKPFPSPGRGCHEVTGEGKAKCTRQTNPSFLLKKVFAFSLIELMISLIAISLITAAFAPIISKRLSTTSISISNFNNQNQNNPQCQKSCSSGKILDYTTCECKLCSDIFPNCDNLCSSDGCEKCKIGYYLNNNNDNNNQCIPCPKGSICEDGITEKLCPEGKYCEGENNIQNCPNSTYSNQGAKTQSDCKIELCEAGSICKEGQKTQCDNPTYSTQGSSECTTCTNCTKCDNKTGSCTECEENYYTNNSTNHKCLPCEEGYYCPGGENNNIISCSNISEGCSLCNKENKCLSCEQGYEMLDDGTCVLNVDWYWFEAGKYYISKYNVGDPGGPLGSSAKLTQAGISVCSVNQTCNGYTGASGTNTTPTCWQGTTATSTCTTYGNYSGCNRTVCNWFGANKACVSLGFTLPTNAQVNQIKNNISTVSNNKGADGLQLCNKQDSNGLAVCLGGEFCKGSKDLRCNAECILTSTFGASSEKGPYRLCQYRLTSFDNYTNLPEYAFGARCVKN